MLFVPPNFPDPTDVILDALFVATSVPLLERGEAQAREIAERELGGRPAFYHSAVQSLAITPFSGGASAIFGARSSLTDWTGLTDDATRQQSYGVVHAAAFEALLEFLDPIAAAALTHKDTLIIGGHGFGAALASLAVAELGPDRFNGRCIVLGAPGVVEVETIETSHREHCERSITSIVNGDDIIPRVPPMLSRLGRTIWLDTYGFPHPPESGPDHLDQDGYSQFLNDVNATFSDAGAGGQAPPNGLELARILRSFIPGLEAHQLENYIRTLRIAMNANTMRRGPAESLGLPSGIFEKEVEAVATVQTAFRHNEATASAFENAAASTGSTADEEMFPVVLRLATSMWTPPDDSIKIQSQFDLFATANVTRAQLHALENDPDVVRCDISRTIAGGGLDLVDAMVQIHGDDMSIPPGLPGGEGAIFGLIDTGIDIFHEAFEDDAGALRIACVWDQFGREVDGNGKRCTPHAIDSKFTQDYGRLYLRSELENIRQNVGPDYAPARLRDSGSGHGTHVASIGAGRATAKMGRGVASGATIMAVAVTRNVEGGEPDSVGYSRSHVDALAFLKRAAQGGTLVAEDRAPIAINVSLGMNAGAHDGQSLLEAAFDAATGLGREPGIAIIKSAGNERANDRHCAVEVQTGVRTDIQWDSSPDVWRVNDYFELWFDWRDDIAFTLTPPPEIPNAPTLSVDAAHSSAGGTAGNTAIAMRLIRNHPDNSDHVLRIDLSASRGSVAPGVWTLGLEGREIGRDNSKAHIWAERGPKGATRFKDARTDYTLSVPGTANTVISVAACDRNAPPGSTPVSSKGPTRTDGQKPDLSAPGADIVAAASQRGPDPSTGKFDAVTTKSGTSMAAPFVTGVVVLGFAKRAADGNPLPNAQQMRRILCRSTQSSRLIHTNTFGFGVIDISKFLNNC